MTLNIKKILKQLDVLFISENDESLKKINSILNIFFRKTIHTNSLENAMKYYTTYSPAVIIIDIDLSDGNGIGFIKEIRKKNKQIPILIITKNKDLENLLEAIKLNLIDYLLKPLDINKFIFNLNLCTKQILNSGDIVTTINKQTKYNYLEKTILYKDKKTSLTKNESKLLELFISNKNRFINKENIRKHVWREKDISESAFKSLVNRLIKKLPEDTINNSFGVGYGIFDKEI